MNGTAGSDPPTVIGKWTGSAVMVVQHGAYAAGIYCGITARVGSTVLHGSSGSTVGTSTIVTDRPPTLGQVCAGGSRNGIGDR